MSTSTLLLSLLNGLSAGLLLFMLASGLTLVFSMMGVMNMAHASFHMLGAYVAWSVAQRAGFWLALCLAPVVVGLLGAAFERFVLRRVHGQGHLAELLVTFGLGVVVVESVGLIWGRQPLDLPPPALLQGPLFTAVQGEGGLHLAWGWPALCAADAAGCTPFPRVRAFAMATAVASLLALALMLAWGRLGLVLRAALRHPRAVEALGHDVPRLFMGVFGIGSALAALAGAVGGLLGAIEPGMAGSVGSVVFAVIVIGGIGSLRGAFVAALFLGMAESFAVGSSLVLGDLLSPFGLQLSADNPAYAIARLSFSQLAAALPFLMLVAVLIVRPQGLLGLSAGNAR